MFFLYEAASSDEPRPKRSKSLPIIYDGKFFEIKEQSGNSIKTKCTICGVIRTGYEGATGNLTKHYKEKHSEKHSDLISYITKKNVVISDSKIKQTTLSIAHLIPNEELNRLIMDFIISENLSFNTLRKTSFRNLLEGISGRKVQLPATQTFEALLRNETDILKENLKDVLGRQNYVCETIDAWSSRATSFIGMTVHFIDESTLERKSYILAFRQVKFKQDHQNLAKFIHNVNKEYDLSPSKIRFAITDGGSAFVKAFEQYADENNEEPQFNNDEFDLFADLCEFENQMNIDIINANDDALENQTIIIDDVTAQSIDLEQVQRDVRVDLDDSSDHLGEIEEIQLPKQFRCTAHNLNLIAGVDFMKNLSKSTAKSIQNVFNKLHVLWGAIRRRSRVKDLCKEILGCILTVPNATRWNSRFDACRKVLQFRSQVIK